MANIDVTPMSKSIQISTEELHQLPTPELTPEPSIPSASSAPQQSPSTVASPTPQILSTTLLLSKVTKLLIIDPTPYFKPLPTQTTAGLSLGGERQSSHKSGL